MPALLGLSVIENLRPTVAFLRDEMQEEDIESALKVLVAYCGATKS